MNALFPRSSPARGDALLAWCRARGVRAEIHPAVLDAAAPHGWRDILQLRHLVRARRPDVVNLHYGDNFISLKDVCAVRLAGSQRLVVTVNHPTMWSAQNARKRLMTRVASLMADHIVVISEATRAVLLNARVPAHKLHVVHCAVQQPPVLPTQALARARLGVPADAFVISSLARLVPHKGIGDLITAIAALPDPHGSLRLVVAGDGPDREALAGLAASLLGSRAQFLGHVEDTADLYAAADVFALPSSMEGFGLVYVEAALHGVPSVGTRVGGVPEAVLDGQTGLLIEAGDVAALTGAIDRLREDESLRLRLGTAARDRARTAFSEARMVDDYERLLRPRRLKSPRSAHGHQTPHRPGS